MKVGCLLLLIPSLALASKPRSERDEELQPPPIEAEASPEAPAKPRNLTLTGDIGLGGWWSSLSVATAFEGSFGFGARLSRHVQLTGELGLGVSGNPTGNSAIVARISLCAVVAWDVLELVRTMTLRPLPFEAGVELGLGLGMLLDRDFVFALPLVQLGVFARYVFSPSVSLGLRLRGQLPFWATTPQSFHGRNVGATTEPTGFTATLSVVRTF